MDICFILKNDNVSINLANISTLLNLHDMQLKIAKLGFAI